MNNVYSYSIVAFFISSIKHLAGLKLGWSCAPIFIVVFFNILRAVFAARCLTIKLPVQLNFKHLINAPKPKPAFVLHKKNEFLRNLSEKDAELYNTIKNWRNSSAEKENIPPYIIFGDKTIEELVEKKPKNEAELLTVFGIGTVKAEKIGSQILRIIGDFASSE